MHPPTPLTQTAYSDYLRLGLITPAAPTALNLKQARTSTHYIWRTVRLRDTGHLQRVVDEYWRRRGDALLGQIADEARKEPGGYFQREVYNTYSMQSIVFSLGGTNIGCYFQERSEWRSDDHLAISGHGNFYLRDEFTDPLDIGMNSPLSSVYRIVDDWMELFDGTVHVKRDRSRYLWRE